MLASDPASILNQNYPDLGIPNRFNPKESDSRILMEHDLFGKPDSTFPDHALNRSLKLRYSPSGRLATDMTGLGQRSWVSGTTMWTASPLRE